HRHHLRRPRLPRPDRHEAPHRLLVGGAHGLRDARHRDPDRLRHQRRGVRHGRPRPPHRHAVLRRRLDEGPLPPAREQAAPRLGRVPGCPAPASAALPGLAGVWGESPPIPSAYNPAEGLSVGLFRTLMVVAAIGTVFAAGYLLWMFQRTAFGTPKEEFANDPAITDISPVEWIAWLPLLVLIVGFGFFPGLIFDLSSPAVGSIARVFGG